MTKTRSDQIHAVLDDFVIPFLQGVLYAAIATAIFALGFTAGQNMVLEELCAALDAEWVSSAKECMQAVGK